MQHSPMYLLGYIPAHIKIHLVDKDVNAYAYGLSLAVVECETAVVRGDTDATSELLVGHKFRVALFLERQGKTISTIVREYV